MQRHELHNLLDMVIDKYINDDYASGRLTNYLENILPNYIESAIQSHTAREKRKSVLDAGSDSFTNTFLIKNKYYYCQHNELFLIYNGIHFTGYSEDNIQHEILTQITAEENLRPWKHKINKHIIKKIKDRSPMSAIPDSETIQFVLQLFLPYFSSRNHVKYFLTIIGDCYRNVEKELIYIVSPVLKNILREITIQIYTYFGISNSLNRIKLKYYDHDYKFTRLLLIDENRDPIQIPLDLQKYSIDVLCVATHYSQRYSSADEFLKQCNEKSLVKHSFYLKNETPDTIIEKFIEDTIHNCGNTSIKTKSMIFIWKKFLQDKKIPNVMFRDSLVSKMKEKLQYDESTESFVGVTSHHLPIVASFINFWDESIIEDQNDTEFEIDEISKLFNKWNGKNHSVVDDSFLIELIRHFYTYVTIDNNKYISNIRCLTWDKRQDVIDSLDLFKTLCSQSETNDTSSSLYKAYENYSKPSCSQFIVSKEYFEKVAKEHIGVHIDDHGVISSKWWVTN